ncbi:hypothetical protein GOP47_0013085 [Adiantum capillus-veneris]|uniref:Tetraspanin-2 n=1 Tax=Adiantum capillus-veneris TaxID=13818 RepID=A0A9D4URW7_ADICA|nr:hypothetical protein GOP47_0013085 [Adiantum capillus-veneris]
MAFRQPSTMPPRPQDTQVPPHQFTNTGYGATRPHPMQRKNLPLILINLATLLLSIPILVVGIWLAARHHADCLRFLQWPLIVIGIVMMVVSLIGLVGALRRRAFLLWVYICLLTLLILLLLAFTIFAFVVTRGSKGHRVWGANFKEYELNDYSHWMRHKMNHHHTWNKIKKCLMKDQVCNNMNNKYPSQSIMWHSKLSYIESGCCKPPTACCYTYVNATNWVNPTTAGANMDCGRWSNDPWQLCYNCDSCKAGVIRQVNKDWRKAAKVALAMLVALGVLYVLAWLSFLQALAHKTLYSTAHSVNARPHASSLT